MKNRTKFIRNIIIVAFISMFLMFFQLPYYISTPGMAKTLSPIIEVENGYKEENGDFMLTTVRIGPANIVQYAFASVSEYHNIYPKEDVRPAGETDEEYHKRQLHMMDTSKESATFVAYDRAGKNVKVESKGVYVLNVLDMMPAEDKLQVGDRIYYIDEVEVVTSETLIEYVSNKNANDLVDIKFERDGKEEKVMLPLKPFPQNKDKVGLGIQLVTDRTVTVSPKVNINTEEIGGPSAGLMFSLEIYNQLVPSDITKGYKIAGTGTMNYEGVVGPIGGIKQKVVAADKAGAEIFFAPYEEGAKNSNYKNALVAAEDINTDMKIVAIDTFDDALKYLEKLEPKM